VGSESGDEAAREEQRLEDDIAAAEDLLAQLEHHRPSPKTNLAIVLLHRLLDKTRADEHGSQRR